ncbi:hypothetical protein Ddye_001414 [Dipteronia dyeriana]|uniref:DUF7036 domain-containing protein n=1 Tax=Dipteronia dyeriana TaxID=168575 RepID=A0AAD9XP69_9ROSI|nr:hypothetical protein Ddye_001414 [Dipteronia dyeriana]
MGKGEQNLPQQQSHASSNPASSRFFCQTYSMVLSTVFKQFSLKCFIVLILGVAVFLSAIFWILPFYKAQSGFEANDTIKISASVQACFRLHKSVSQLVLHIERLEYDIYEEISVPNTKVAILSMRRLGVSNWTDVVFGVLSDPINVPINPVSLSVLRSSLIELFLQQSNLTLTTSIFGQPSRFEILKFPEGITVIPMQSVSIWQISQILFNFTLNNSTSRIVENFVELRDQLKYGLHLRTYENVYVQVTNTFGSTIFSPVTVQASVMSDLGGLLPQRLKQLAETITDSPAENLGLDNLVFGKVKGVILSSYLKHTLHATPPTPSPSPTPKPSISPYPTLSPTYSPAPSPNIHHLPPCFGSEAPSPSDHNNLYSPSRITGPSPAPLDATAHPPCPYRFPVVPPSSSPAPHPNPTHSTAMGPPKSALDLSPLPEVSCGSTPDNDVGSATSPVSPSLAPSPSSLAVGPWSKEIWLLGFSGLLIFHILCWSDYPFVLIILSFETFNALQYNDLKY